ncbi:MAG: primosomal protein N' [Thiohalomonadaceae bacterium]
MKPPVLRVAVPSPLRRTFDYLSPTDPAPAPGSRVRVPFGRRETVGVVVQVVAESELPRERLKPARVIDETPLLPRDVIELLRRAMAYYHHAPGDVFATALPVALRQGAPARVRAPQRFRLTAAGRAVEPGSLRRAPRQAAALALLAAHPAGLDEEALFAQLENGRDAVRKLVEKGWLEAEERPCLQAAPAAPSVLPVLHPAQQTAVETVLAGTGSFGVFLVDGVTGSGKTEVYLRLIEATLSRGEQALVLVPEIGLTPQLVERFRRRFAVPIAVLHSGLADGERLCAWLAAREGQAPVVIGTRSAVFTPLAHLGLIVVDEEHDPSFKQQEGFRYSGRDLAILRGQLAGVPVVLGSATPSLESLHNANEGRYRHLSLPERAGAASHPVVHLVDLRTQPLYDGLSPTLMQALDAHLQRGHQALLFLNRRGYAPALLCHACGHVFDCRRCDARMTLYAGDRRLRCHHCGADHAAPARCPECGGDDLRPVGRGTERLEEALQRRYGPGVVRIDRDSTRRKGSLAALLEQVHEGEARVLIGTQMLAKGHHFPKVTLVGIVDADRGLFSADFRGAERMAQLIVQVAGRAGRAEQPGEVLIQTHHPDHPLLARLTAHDYGGFAAEALAERRAAELPPFSHLALIRAEAGALDTALDFLRAAARTAVAAGHPGVELLGPVPAPMERRAGRHRAQLLLQATRRADLHRLLDVLAPALETLPEGRRARWSLDVDPAEMF